MKKFTKKATNGSGRRMKKAVGHENGKRVSALRGRRHDVTLTDSKGDVLFEGSDDDLKTAARRVGRANVIPSNGDLPTSMEVAPETVTIGEAMRRAVEELGETVINDELAPSQLRQLAETYEEVERARAAFTAKNDAAKVAKKSLDSITDLLLQKVREFTHPTPLPLFDMKQAEDDQAEMIAGGDVQELGLQ